MRSGLQLHILHESVATYAMQGLADSVRGVMQQEQVQLHQAFRDRHRYLMKVLTAKTLKISGQSELHNLVTVLNFNDFYRESKF